MKQNETQLLADAIRHAVSKTFTSEHKNREHRLMIARVIADSAASLSEFVESSRASEKEKRDFQMITEFTERLLSPESE